MSIKVTSVSKSYKTQKALNDVSFFADKGEIIGFLGPNGAGKSTLMKILTGYIQPTNGQVYVNDIDVLQFPIKAQKSIGYLPEHNPLYKEMYVREYLQFRAAIFKINKGDIETCIEKVGLKKEVSKKISQLSKGYQQRVGLAAAILHNPDVLILDEPTTGLDPNQIIEIRTLIKELGKDKTVLFSTHIMQEVEAVCDRVLIIKKGEVLVDKKMDDLKKHKHQVIEVMFDITVDANLFKKLPNIVSLENTTENTWQLVFESDLDMRSQIFDLAQENNLKILGLNTQNKNLETFFREVTG